MVRRSTRRGTASRRTRSRALTLVLLLFVLPLLPAGVHAAEMVGPSAPAHPVAEDILSREPKGPPQGATPTGGSIPATYRGNASTQRSVTLDETTVFNAIALARRSGTVFTVAEPSDVDERVRRDADANQLPGAGLALDALLVGSFAPQIFAAIFSLLVPFAAIGLPHFPFPTQLLVLLHQNFALDKSRSQRASLDDETTDGALALMGGGVPVEVRGLITRRDANTTKLGFDQTSILSLPLATAVVALGLVPAGNLTVRQLENATLNDTVTTNTSHEVSIDRDDALGAVAIRRQGLVVNVDDLIDSRDVTATTHAESSRRAVGHNDVVSAHVLGTPVKLEG